jgi:hypothetical protein
MHALPRSRTLPLLRTPAPFRLLSAVLGWVGLCAVVVAAAPDLADRARLAAVLTDATATRIDPLLEHALRGVWPARGPIASLKPSADPEDALARRITEDGIAITQTRRNDRVDLALGYMRSRGDTIYWRCRAAAPDGGDRIAPLSLPAGCRE